MSLFKKVLIFLKEMVGTSNEVSVNRCIAIYCIIIATFCTFFKYPMEDIYIWLGNGLVVLGFKALEKIKTI